MKLRSLHNGSKEIGFGQACRLVAEMGPEILYSRSNELFIMRDSRTNEYWSLEDDRVPIHIMKKLAKLASGIIENDQLKNMPVEIYPDLRAGKVNSKSRKQAVVFLCRQIGDYSQRVPSLDDRGFWMKLEKAFPPR